MKNFLFLFLGLMLFPVVMGQAPGAFSYQAIVTSNDGTVLASQTVRFRLSLIQGSIDGPVVYSEVQLDTTTASGLVVLHIGMGTTLTGDFGTINWSKGPYFLKNEMDPAGGTEYKYLGTSQLLSVPFAMFAGNVREVKATPDIGPDEPIFQVSNSAGEVLFAVYNSGVRIVMDESSAKGGRGGFVVSGRTTGKGTPEDYLVLNRDTALITINDYPLKGGRGGFAVGGRNPAKGAGFSYMEINQDSTNFFLHKAADGSETAFNIFNVDESKITSQVLSVTKDSTKMSTSLNVARDIRTSGSLVANTLSVKISKITDQRDGQNYGTIAIGTQTWMTENLRAVSYLNGDPIPLADGNDAAKFNAMSSGVRTYYGNDSVKFYQTYGGLYNWYAVTDPRGLCPLGWHVPSQPEYQLLITLLGGTDVAGGKLKTTGTTDWNTPNTGATNETGFSALPGGYAAPFDQLSKYGYYWTTTPSSLSTAINLVINYDGAHVVFATNPIKQQGFSVRCIHD